MSKKDKETPSREEEKAKVAQKEIKESLAEAAAPAAEEKKAIPVEISSEKLDELEKKAKASEEYYDRLLRQQAEFENYKKRTARDVEEFRKIANEALIEMLLPVLDNFDRALFHAAKDTDPKHILEGIQMIRKLFEDALRKQGLTDIHSLGEKFDPHIHEAIAFEETDEKEEGIVVEVFQHGYLLHDRLLRPATVKITKKKTK